MESKYDELKEIIGYPVDPDTGERIEVVDESDNFYTCPSCKQAVDMRNLGQVFHHEEDGHKALPVN